MREAPREPGFERIEATFSGHAFDPHRHDCYALGLTLEGVQSFNYRGARRDSVAGRAIVLYPDERHDGEAGRPGGFRYRMLYLAPRLVSEALEAITGRPDLPFAPVVSQEPRLVRALATALGDLNRPLEPLQREQLVLALAEALHALDRSRRRARREPPDPSAAERARALLEAECGRVVTVQELEAASDLERFSLIRQFKARFGTSPYRYLCLRRLERARALIRAGESLSLAAAGAGFADQAHLTRSFRAAYGLTPGRWRAMLAG